MAANQPNLIGRFAFIAPIRVAVVVNFISAMTNVNVLAVGVFVPPRHERCKIGRGVADAPINLRGHIIKPIFFEPFERVRKIARISLKTFCVRPQRR